MDGPVFDAMLKTALEEALMEDMKELEGAPPRTSLRQRRRMKRMLADPWGYARRLRAAETAETPPHRRKTPARWLTAAVVAALLTGTAAGYALRGGAFFQKMFEESAWAAHYGGAADTGQLLEMGGGGLGVAAEDAHFRFELLDAIAEGETAMAAVRVTVLDTALLEEAFGAATVSPGKFLEEGGSFLDTGTTSTEYCYADMDPTLAEDQLLMIYRTDGERTGGEQTLEIEFRDFGYTRYDGEDPNGEDVVLVPGTWTIPVELRFRAIREMEIGRKIQADGCAFTLDRIRLSALSVGLDIHCGQEDAEHLSELLRSATFLMEDGRAVEAVGYCLAGKGEDEAGYASEVLYEFGMPLERDRLSALCIGGERISLRP